MATEPTLGRRIMIEATICKDAPAGSAMVRKAWADLRTLAARADAAERLAVASHVYADAYDERWALGAADELWELEEAARKEHIEALAAWRALGEVDG